MTIRVRINPVTMSLEAFTDDPDSYLLSINFPNGATPTLKEIEEAFLKANE